MLSHQEILLVAEEIRELAADAAVQKVFSAGEDGHAFRLRAPGTTYLLLADYSPLGGRIGFIREKPPQPQSPTTITQALRQRLMGTRLQDVNVHPVDRVVTLTFRVQDSDALELVIELTGRSTRATLVDEGAVLHPVGGSAHPHERGSEFKLDLGSPPEPGDVRWGLDDVPIGARSQVVEDEYGPLVEAYERDQAQSALLADVRRARKRVKRLCKNLERDLANAEQAEDMKREAELLQSAYGKVERGAKLVAVQNFYDPDLKEIEISLDPAKSLQENIDQRFHAYRRLKDAIPQIEERLLVTMDKLEQLEDAVDSILALNIEEVAQLRGDLMTRGLIRPKQQRKRRGHAVKRVPYREFVATSGRPILVGRGSKDNDELSTHIARGRDIWLHARDWAGSHVIVRMNKGDEINSQDLIDAAVLAAHFSKGKNDSLVDVTHTFAKHVRKPKGAAPGLVTISGGNTITVNPADARLNQLLLTETKK